jgi:hypothetical protein
MERIVSKIGKQTTSIEHVLSIREHLDGSSNPSLHPSRSNRTLRDGSFGVRYPRHFVPGYDRAVPAGHLPVALTPPYAHDTVPILYQTVSYTYGMGTLRARVPGVRVGLRSLTRIAHKPGNQPNTFVSVLFRFNFFRSRSQSGSVARKSHERFGS